MKKENIFGKLQDIEGLLKQLLKNSDVMSLHLHY